MSLRMFVGLFLITLITSVFSIETQAKKYQYKKDLKTIYKYKKYEKFDFEEIQVEGEIVSPGDLSIRPMYQNLFKNRLPYRKNFNPEIRKSISKIR